MKLCRETYWLHEFYKIADTHTDAFDADEEIQPVETDDKGYVNEVLFKLTKSPKDWRRAFSTAYCTMHARTSSTSSAAPPPYKPSK